MGYAVLMNITSVNIGKAGELRVSSELLLRGFRPAAFYQDTGVDIILSNGKRLQVKTSLKPIHSKNDYSWRYSFNIRQSQFRGSKDGRYERRYTKRDYKNEVDYFVFWCVEHDYFYIIPENEIGEKVSFCISTPKELRKYKCRKDYKPTSKYEKYRGNWEQLR